MNKRALRAPRFTVTALECFERPVTLRLPFRFGAATVEEAPQAFVRATIQGTDGRVAQGFAAADGFVVVFVTSTFHVTTPVAPFVRSKVA